MLNLYPTLSNTNDVDENLQFTLSQGDFLDITVQTTARVSQPALPLEPSDQDKVWEFRVLADGAKTLAATTVAAVSLAALTLY